MLKVTETQIFGWEAAIRGMRNPMNSWDKSDTDFSLSGMQSVNGILVPTVGDNDLALMHKLVKAGSDHSKFMRMITVTMDITAPLYWWKEYDTYKVGTVANSCSTMHKIHAKEFTLDDFSHEHLFDDEDVELFGKELPLAGTALQYIIDALNIARDDYLKTNDKKYWQQMIQLLPTSFNQKRTLHLNYAVLRNIYHARKNHKLTEWHTLCDWIHSLPYSELITDDFKEDTSHEK